LRGRYRERVRRQTDREEGGRERERRGRHEEL
jgi:hypothetical protein